MHNTNKIKDERKTKKYKSKGMQFLDVKTIHGSDILAHGEKSNLIFKDANQFYSDIGKNPLRRYS